MKTCSKCKIPKKLVDFNKRTDGCGNDGRESWCRKCKHNNKQKWYVKNKTTPNSRYKTAISNSKARELEFDISLDGYSKLISQDCYYCQANIKGEMGVGLDRLNSNKHYTIDNVVPCCARCNICRNEYFTPEEWKFMMTTFKEYKSLPADGSPVS
jgi:hypothetical protein